MILLPTMILLPLFGRFMGVDYDVIADNTANVLRGIVPMVGLSLIWGLFMAWRSGWLLPIFTRQAASAMPKFFWLIPLCWVVFCLCRLMTSSWSTLDATYLGVLALAMVMVGFNEELLFRGILAYGARGEGPWSEARTMLISSFGFGLFHLPNLLTGQALTPTLIQVGYAFVMGLALFASMRISRTILLPVALHALWDFSTFASKGGEMNATLSFVSFAMLVIIILLLIVLVLWSLGKKRRLITDNCAAKVSPINSRHKQP